MTAEQALENHHNPEGRVFALSIRGDRSSSDKQQYSSPMLPDRKSMDIGLIVDAEKGVNKMPPVI